MKKVRQDILYNEVLAFGWRINYLANYYSLIVNRRLGKLCKITRQEFVVLFCLANSDNLTAQDITEVTARPKNTISRAVNTLMKKGLISKTVHPTDGRAEILKLKPTGRRLYDQAIEILQERDRAMTERLSATERKTLKRLLDKMLEGFNPWSEGHYNLLLE